MLTRRASRKRRPRRGNARGCPYGRGRPLVRLVAAITLGAFALVSLAVLQEALDHDRATAAPRQPTCGAPCPRADVTATQLNQTGALLPHALQARVTIGSHAGVMLVPPSFLGISTEYRGLPLFERHRAIVARVLSLLHVPGGGPLVLRVGGNSADATFWNPTGRRLPDWAFSLTKSWFAYVGSLLTELRARLILDLNLVTDTPQVAARVATAARADLPRGRILGLEVGNEPDIYSRAYWLATFSSDGLWRSSALPNAISAATYEQDFDAYAGVLARAAPNFRLVGPALALPALDLKWISTLLANPHPRLGIVSAHLYPYSACVERRSPAYPTIARLLSERATAGLARAIRPAVVLSRRAGLTLRLTELNSVTCGGLAGISDTFATALWAPDALFELLQAGVVGVNVHIRAQTINGAFALTPDGLQARPLLYGLILFARALGPGAELVHADVRTPSSLHLKGWAVRTARGMLHVLIINKSARAANVQLQLPASGAATLQSMLAPSARSYSGVTLGGQHLGRDGRWRGALSHQTITPGARGYQLTIPRLSAELLTVRLQRGAITTKPRNF